MLQQYTFNSIRFRQSSWYSPKESQRNPHKCHQDAAGRQHRQCQIQAKKHAQSPRTSIHCSHLVCLSLFWAPPFLTGIGNNLNEIVRNGFIRKNNNRIMHTVEIGIGVYFQRGARYQKPWCPNPNLVTIISFPSFRNIVIATQNSRTNLEPSTTQFHTEPVRCSCDLELFRCQIEALVNQLSC